MFNIKNKKYVYFISFMYKQPKISTISFTNAEVPMKKKIKNIKDINEIQRYLEKNYEKMDATITNYKLMRRE